MSNAEDRLRRLLAAAAVVVATAGIVVAVTSHSGHPSRVTTYQGHTVIRGGNVTSTVRFGDYAETFAPPPPFLHAKLTALQAYDAFDKRNKPIPPAVSYRLGIITSPPSVTDVLVWGFSGPPGQCMRFGGLTRVGVPTPTPTPPATTPPQQCIEWDFISATTGGFILGTGQTIGGPAFSTPPPSPASRAMKQGGFLDAQEERFAPDALVLQGPESILRWTFDNEDCTIQLHWFLPQASQSSASRAPCPWTHKFVESVESTFTSRGRVFTVVAGYVHTREHYLVRASLENGKQQIYDAADADGAWMFAVQRCGDIDGTAIHSVTEVRYRRGVVKTIEAPSEPDNTSLASNCKPN